MRKFLGIATMLLAIGMLVTGCVTTTGQTIQKYREQGCESLTPEERELIVLLMRSKFEDYPEDGICDPLWKEKFLIKKLEERAAENG